jgi:plasmid stability protein
LTASTQARWNAAMPTVTVRNLPDEVHRALRLRAAKHGRSTEAEVRAILIEAAKPQSRLKLGSMLADIGRRLKFSDEEFALLNQRDRSAPRDVDFE